MAKNDQLLSEKEIKKLLRPYVDKVKKDFLKASRQAIIEFYADYDPDSYKRTYGFLNMSNGESTPIVTEKELPDGYELVFHYRSADITNHFNKGANEAIFNGPFEAGFHGGPKYGGPKKVTVPSPYQRMLLFAANYKL